MNMMSLLQACVYYVNTEQDMLLKGRDIFFRRLCGSEYNSYLQDDGIDGWKSEAFVISGGLGALGLTAANHLVSQGVVNIVLLSRSGKVDSASWEAWRNLRNSGCNVLVLRCDVSVAHEVRRAMKIIQAKFHTLSILHTAGVLKDTRVENMAVDDMMDVLRPKAEGAWSLHQSTLGVCDVFVGYTSVSGWLGNAGQANYSFANSAGWVL